MKFSFQLFLLIYQLQTMHNTPYRYVGSQVNSLLALNINAAIQYNTVDKTVSKITEAFLKGSPLIDALSAAQCGY